MKLITTHSKNSNNFKQHFVECIQRAEWQSDLKLSRFAVGIAIVITKLFYVY